jgi:hypothetical protein
VVDNGREYIRHRYPARRQRRDAACAWASFTIYNLTSEETKGI